MRAIPSKGFPLSDSSSADPLGGSRGFYPLDPRLVVSALRSVSLGVVGFWPTKLCLTLSSFDFVLGAPGFLLFLSIHHGPEGTCVPSFSLGERFISSRLCIFFPS